MKDISTLILAGGLGTRLRPLTFSIPKPMISINGDPIILNIIRQLKKYNFKTIFISTGYMSDVIKAYLKNGSNLGVNIKYIDEKKPLGTAGPLSLIKNSQISENFFIINGDIETNINLNLLKKFHLNENSDLTVCVKKTDIKSRYGDIKTDKYSNIIDIIEKPTFISNINCGMYMINKKIFSLTKINQKLTMPELITRSIKRGLTVKSFFFKEQWRAIEDLNDLKSLTNLKL